MSEKTDTNNPPSDWDKSGPTTASKVDTERELLNLVTQETRFVLIQNIVAHPKEMPSLKELAYANPSKSKSTIRNHLDKLMEAGVIEKVELPEKERRRDLPYRFYRVSDLGQDLLEKHDLLRAKETLSEMYSALEKTEKIEKYMHAPRPGDEKDQNGSTDSGDDSRRLIEP